VAERGWRLAPDVARVGARLGLATGFAGAVSMDVFGEEILRLCAQAVSINASSSKWRTVPHA